MNNTPTFKIILTNLFVLVTFCVTTAQVQFSMKMLDDGETYQVSLIPEKTWTHPYNITSTAQVTIKVPTKNFEIDDLKSLQDGIDWEANSRSDSPVEAPGTDYISFGLITLGTVGFNYEAGVEMPLFTFKNALPCSGSVVLINNEEDVFMSPNSRSVNVGNSITIFGARGEAYTNNLLNNSEVPCDGAGLSTSDDNIEVGAEKTRIYPNPAVNEVFVDMNWTIGDTDGDLIILDAAGREVKRQAVTLNTGLNQIKLPVEKLAFGIYSIEVQFDGRTIALDRFVKGAK